MKIKYECEADENGYVEKVFVDGKQIFSTTSIRTDYGTKQTEGDNLEECYDGVLNAIYDEIPTFLGLKLCQIAEDLS